MGKKKVGEPSQAPSIPKKTSRGSSSLNSPSRTKGTKDAYPLILPLNTKGLVFVNNAQKLKYETLSARKTSEQKFWHADSLRTLDLLDDVVSSLRNLWWMHYVEQKYVSMINLSLNF